MLRSAVERQFEIIGRGAGAARKLDGKIVARITTPAALLPPHILIHGIADIDERLVWDISRPKLPVLRQIEALERDMNARHPPHCAASPEATALRRRRFRQPGWSAYSAPLGRQIPPSIKILSRRVLSGRKRAQPKAFSVIGCTCRRGTIRLKDRLPGFAEIKISVNCRNQDARFPSRSGSY